MKGLTFCNFLSKCQALSILNYILVIYLANTSSERVINLSLLASTIRSYKCGLFEWKAQMLFLEGRRVVIE